MLCMQLHFWFLKLGVLHMCLLRVAQFWSQRTCICSPVLEVLHVCLLGVAQILEAGAKMQEQRADVSSLG